MCGIAGFIQKDPHKFQAGHLHKMTDALSHRGPDGYGYWQNDENTVLFGHRRLSIIDLSEAGQQPMHYMDRYVIMHNGEIYNYIEIRKILEALGYKFRTATDTEVIAAAYDQWKEDCLEYFDGMFAFCIWDKKENSFFAARDRFGEKPFYYIFDDGCFSFASEMKAFWAAGFSKVPNKKLLFNFITIGYTDNPEMPEETFYEEIFKLPAACWLRYTLATQELTIASYWDLDIRSVNKKITDEQAIETFEDLFATSVKMRLRSDVLIGTSLSGGLDSSSIAALCSMGTTTQLSHQCFTASFKDFQKDETLYATQVAKQFGLKQHIVSISAKDLVEDLQRFSRAQEEPFGSASVYAQYKVYELAKQAGVTVLLDGQGADETMAGYSKYYKWYWQELFRRGKLFRSKEIKAAAALGVTEGFGVKNMVAAWFPDFASVVLERQYLLKALRQEDLSKEYVRAYSNEAYYTPPEHTNLNGLLYFNTRTHGLEELLRYADRNSMAHGREVRLPFLSHELVEFIFSLPSHFKIRKGWTKWILRESMKDKLPASVCWRKDKIGFEPPQKDWMQQLPLREAIQEAKKVLVRENILKPSVMDKPVRPQGAYEADNYDWRYFSSAILFM
jgi:asparagine synthase (glutamine-hydrolysing)